MKKLFTILLLLSGLGGLLSSPVSGQTNTPGQGPAALKRILLRYTALGAPFESTDCSRGARLCIFTGPDGRTTVEMSFLFDATKTRDGIEVLVPMNTEESPEFVTGDEESDLDMPIQVASIPSMKVATVIDGNLLNEAAEVIEARPSYLGQIPASLVFYRLPTDEQGRLSGDPAPLPVFSLFPHSSAGTSLPAASLPGGSGSRQASNSPVVVIPNAAGSGSKTPWKVLVGSLGQSSASGGSGGNAGSSGGNAQASSTSRLEERTIDYIYDGLGRPVRRNDSSPVSLAPKKYWFYFGTLRLMESFGSEQGQTRTILEFFHGSRGLHYLIQTIRNSSSDPLSNSGYALHQDALGSTVAITDESDGSVVQRDYYDPFGNISVQTPNPASSKIVFNPIRFTGQYHDGPAGVYLFPYRAYDPQNGRFLQPDPIEYLDGPNLYSYVGNSPYAFTDPLGLDKKSASGEGGWNLALGLEDMKRGCLGCAPGSSLITRLWSSLFDPVYAQQRGIDPVKNLHDEAIKYERQRLYGHLPPGYGDNLPVAIDLVLPGSTAEVAFMAGTSAIGGAVKYATTLEKTLESVGKGIKGIRKLGGVGRTVASDFRIIEKEGRRFIEFNAQEAHFFNDYISPGNGSPDTLAVIATSPEGGRKIIVYEGKHRALGAALGEPIDLTLGGIPERPGWLRYEYDGVADWPRQATSIRERAVMYLSTGE